MVHDHYVSSTGKIPEEAKALSLLAPATPVPSLMPGGGLLPIPSHAPLQNLGLPLAARLGLDSSVAALSAISSQTPIIGNVDPSKIDEIRRTVYVGNLNSQTTAAEQLMEFFKQVGEVKFVRMAGDETQPTRFAFVEFSNQECVSRALAFNGVMFGDRPLKINHSNNAIVKPPELTPQAAAKELEDVMKRVREAQSTIAAAIEPENKKRSSSRSRRRRRSHSRSRSRSHSQHRCSRSRQKNRASQRSWRTSDSRNSHKRHSRDKRHSRSRSRDRRKDSDGKTRRSNDGSSRGRDKGKTPVKGHRRSRSNSRGHKKISKSSSRSQRKKSKSPSPRREKKEKRKQHVRDSSVERSWESTSRRRRSRDRQQSKSYPKQREIEYKQKVLDYESYGEDVGSGGSEDLSPQAEHNGKYNSLYPEDEEDLVTTN
ncbi:splicing regulatory glutamine/lysine-rich protein 1 isoform X2 [Trichomycterus rosablanca]|uniref:splicing regulatory glutamine/lysine-rich protein 1 isoform X2 n=1 Tax=Trichomycterus rosablanca TaxID=2290929 RepID=UPI002F35119E